MIKNIKGIRDGNKISYEDAIAGMEVDTEDGTTE